VIKELTSVGLSECQARRIMKRLASRHRKVAGVPAKSDPQLQLDFLARELLPRMEEARKGERRVFFVAAAHFVMGAFLRMIWCVSRLFVKTSSERQRYSVLGAVETRDHDLVTIRTAGSVNSMSVCDLMKKISQRYPGEKISLVMDNARYQYNQVKELAASLNLELLYLPPYSPNLSLIERLWKLVKTKCLRNRYYEHFGEFKAAIDSCLTSLNGSQRDALKSLPTENFQILQNPNS
jgi:hypothetical protein